MDLLQSGVFVFRTEDSASQLADLVSAEDRF
jgi:hypothetical protein